MKYIILIFCFIVFLTLGSWTFNSVSELNLLSTLLLYSINFQYHFLNDVSGPLPTCIFRLYNTSNISPIINAGQTLEINIAQSITTT